MNDTWNGPLMSKLIDDAKENLRDEVYGQVAEWESFPNDARDLVYEYVDSAMPVYTSEILDLAREDTCLVTEDPELGYETPLQGISWNIYERINHALHVYVDELELQIGADLRSLAELESDLSMEEDASTRWFIWKDRELPDYLDGLADKLYDEYICTEHTKELERQLSHRLSHREEDDDG